MNAQSAKMKSLEQLIELMDGSTLGKLKRKGEASKPDASMTVAVAADPKGAMDPEDILDGGKDEASEGDQQSMDPEMLKKLMEMYGKDDSGAC